MRFATFPCVLLVAAHALAADGPNTAARTFKSQTVTLEVNSAVAFRGKSFADHGGALIVAVTNARLNADAIADYLDRRRVHPPASSSAMCFSSRKATPGASMTRSPSSSFNKSGGR